MFRVNLNPGHARKVQLHVIPGNPLLLELGEAPPIWRPSPPTYRRWAFNLKALEDPVVDDESAIRQGR